MDRPTSDFDRIQRLHDEALAEAQALRREAIADFWRGADGLLTDAATRARRSAERLAQRLRHRERLHGAR